MLLAVDIGNSNIVMGIWNGGQWTILPRVDTHPVLNAEQYRKRLKELFAEQSFALNEIRSVIVSSVVPPITGPIEQALADLFDLGPIILNARTDTGIRLTADYPDRVGTDLIADAAGAYHLVNESCIVVDFGTATTVMAVEKPGVLGGVSICSGLKVSVEALVGKTAQLQNIPLEIPSTTLGKNTAEAMQAGLVLGHLCMVEGLIDRMKKEVGSVKVVATGGLVSLFAPETDHFDYIEPTLTLDGLRLIAERQSE